MFGLIKLAIRLTILALALFAFFTVPLGEKTLYQHVSGLLSTEEAKELGRELKGATQKLGDAIQEGRSANAQVEDTN
ncbi:MAG: hypothetical protein GX614_05060 [Sandaracinaceae bacterium]|nr:hypothetical protein [Sandaracinaceae bacterium]